jgi:hypothetical protein
MASYTIRHCAGNRQAWGCYTDGRDPSDYGYCVMTSMSLDLLVEQVRVAFNAPVGSGHVRPGKIALDLDEWHGNGPKEKLDNRAVTC